MRLRLARGRFLPHVLTWNFGNVFMRSCFLLSLCFAVTTALPASNPKAQKAFKDGLRYESISQWKEAEKAYSEAILSDPGDAPSYQHRGKVRYALGDYQHALADADVFLKMQPGS